MRRSTALAATLALALGAAPQALGAADDPAAEVEAWKLDRDQRLRRPDGWLTLVGLWWLAEGDNAVGSGGEGVVRGSGRVEPVAELEALVPQAGLRQSRIHRLQVHYHRRIVLREAIAVAVRRPERLGHPDGRVAPDRRRSH